MARVLFVEDEAALRSALASFLRLQGIDLVEAGSLHAARELLQSEPFELLVTDESLGDGRGSELVRSFAPSAERPVLIVTATPERIDDDVRAHPHVEVQRKPLRPAQLAAWIREHLPAAEPRTNEDLCTIWKRLVGAGLPSDEIDRILLVLLDLPGARLLDVRREGERLCLLVDAVEPVRWSQTAVDLGVDSWTTRHEDDSRHRVVVLPLPWRSQCERGRILDLAGCEGWDLARIESAVADAKLRGLRVVNLSSWHRLGLVLRGRGDLALDVFAASGAGSPERRMLWSVTAPAREAADGQ